MFGIRVPTVDKYEMVDVLYFFSSNIEDEVHSVKSCFHKSLHKILKQPCERTGSGEDPDFKVRKEQGSSGSDIHFTGP